jgi:hypothetical protein
VCERHLGEGWAARGNVTLETNDGFGGGSEIGSLSPRIQWVYTVPFVKCTTRPSTNMITSLYSQSKGLYFVSAAGA